MGSSPLTRGKRVIESETAPLWGLIPAHAGKTVGACRGATPAGAHPRSRGENAVIDTLIADRAGSSPLTRGKRLRVRMHAPGRGLIPAHAGKTHRPAVVPGRSPAHPRSRGENVCHAVFPSGRNGLIPAHAGKTLSASVSGPFSGAHPRSRGENGLTL